MAINLNQLIHTPHFAAAAACGTGSFFSFPSWDEYLPCVSNAPELTNINDVWLIVAAVVEILLRLAGILAVVMIIYGGIQYTTSQGSPEQTGKALNTIIAAVVGLVICIISAVVITFIAKSF